MSNEQLAKELQALLDPLFTVVKVEPGNYKVDDLPGHPFTIGPEHVAHAADYCGGMLGDETVEAIGCAHEDRSRYYGRKCGRPHSAHTSELIAWVNLNRNLGNKEAAQCLSRAKPLMAEHKIAGVAFLNMGPDKEFNIAPPEDEDGSQPNGPATLPDQEA